MLGILIDLVQMYVAYMYVIALTYNRVSLRFLVEYFRHWYATDTKE